MGLLKVMKGKAPEVYDGLKKSVGDSVRYV